MSTYDQQMLLLFAMASLPDVQLLQDALGRLAASVYLRATSKITTLL